MDDHQIYIITDLSRKDRDALKKQGFKTHGQCLYHPTHWAPTPDVKADIWYDVTSFNALTPEAKDFADH